MITQKMKLIRLFIMIPIVALLLSSCGKRDNHDILTAAAPITGTMVGYVDLYDQYGDYLSNASGITVTLPSGQSTMTDANGKYILSGIPIGYYNILFTKTGFGTAESTSQQILGSDTLFITGRKQMSQIPNFQASSINLGFSKNNVNLVITGTVNTTDPKVRRLIFFANDSSLVSANPSSYKYTNTVNVLSDSTNYSLSVPLSTLYAAGFGSGSTIYIAAYGSAYQSGSSATFSSVYGRSQFNAISAATPPVASIKLP